VLIQIKKERLHRLFDEYGQVTECSLKYTKDGVFRKFAFIGFHNESDASSAVTHRNNTYIDTAKIEVLCIVLLPQLFITFCAQFELVEFNVTLNTFWRQLFAGN